MFELLLSLEGILYLVQLYGPIVVFVAVLLTGEGAIFLSALLATEGHLSFFTVLAFSFWAALLTDLFWFLAGRYFPAQFLPTKMKNVTNNAVEKIMRQFFGQRIFLPILCLKFFYGFRIISVIYFARSPLSFIRFIIYDIIGTTAYVFLFMVLGQGVGLLLLQVFPGINFSGVFGLGVTIILIGFLIIRSFRASNPIS